MLCTESLRETGEYVLVSVRRLSRRKQAFRVLITNYQSPILSNMQKRCLESCSKDNKELMRREENESQRGSYALTGQDTGADVPTYLCL